MSLIVVDALGEKPPESSIMERYNTIRLDRSTELPTQQIDIQSVASSAEDCSSLFAIALDLWKQNVVSLKLSHEGIVPTSGIKQLRKFGLILRTAYRMFDQSHDFPDEFGQLVYEMGQKTDLLRVAKVNGNTIPQNIFPAQVEAGSTNETLLARASNLTLDFTPSSIEGFYGQYYKVLDNIKATITRPSLSLEELHDMRRKCLRHMSNVFQLASLRTLDPTLVSIFNFLHSLDKELGDNKDTYEELAWSGASVGQLAISPGIVTRLESFIASHKR